ncbi:hypothetical protein EDC04DRAFT_2683852 [Pisolithus marmoratus]|nr:hypothetical protein EDC04DRAFT_2683852 [Pisolithus marmoratus]
MLTSFPTTLPSTAYNLTPPRRCSHPSEWLPSHTFKFMGLPRPVSLPPCNVSGLAWGFARVRLLTILRPFFLVYQSWTAFGHCFFFFSCMEPIHRTTVQITTGESPAYGLLLLFVLLSPFHCGVHPFICSNAHYYYTRSSLRVARVRHGIIYL